MSSDPFANFDYITNEHFDEHKFSNVDLITDEWAPPKEEKSQEGWGDYLLRSGLQVPLGLAEGTLPGILSNLSQFISTGEALDPLEIERIREISEQEGIPFDEQKYLKNVQEAAKHFPSISNLARMGEEATGIPLEANDEFQKFIRFGSTASKITPSGLTLRPLNTPFPRPILGTGIAATKEALLQMGLPEPLAEILSFFILKQPTTASKATVSPEIQEIRDISEQYDLRKIAGMESENPPKITPIVSPKREAKIKSELDTSSMNAINEVIEQNIPIKKMKDKGINLEDAYTQAYDKAQSSAKTFDSQGTKEIDLSPLIKNIQSKIVKIKSSAPSLSTSDKKAINELEKQLDQLTFFGEKPTIHGGYYLQGSKTRLPKKITATQALDQYRNFNEEVKGIYRKPEFTGSEEEVLQVYRDLKDDLINSINEASPELGNDLKFANKIFHETSKLEAAENIFDKTFENGYDPIKLHKTLGQKSKRVTLERSLGKNAVRDLEKIAKYGKIAEERVFKVLENPKTAKDFLETITPLKLGWLAIKHGSTLGLFYEGTKGLARRAQGLLFTREATRTALIDYLKSAVSPLSQGFKSASKDLTRAINNEFGSEEELLKLLEKDNESQEQTI